jgi:chromosome segregation ATPase
MAGRTRTKGSKAVRAMSAEARAAYTELQKHVDDLGKSIARIQRDARRAEQRIEADARQRIRALRKEARDELGRLQSRRREVSRTLKSLSAAAGDSWREIKRSADSIAGDARMAAAAVLARFRSALGR